LTPAIQKLNRSAVQFLNSLAVGLQKKLRSSFNSTLFYPATGNL